MCKVHPKFAFNFGGVMLNIYNGDRGDKLVKHSHTYDHGLMCNSGSMIVRMENREEDLVMDKNHPPINLPANEWHEFEMLEDGTVFANMTRETDYANLILSNNHHPGPHYRHLLLDTIPDENLTLK